MKNLKNFDEDCFEIYKEAVRNKDAGGKKETLSLIKPTIRLLYLDYSDKFRDNEIYNLTSHGFADEEKDYLIDLYQYKSAIIKKVKKKILDSQIITINATCQYCTLNSINTLDHFIPKGDFPEFSVNPLNLLPCCSECNAKKSKYAYNGEESLFLNLYLDELPEKKYLKADFDFSNGVPIVTFDLYNPDDIEESLYRTISNHYKRLDLLERMRLKSNEVITEIINPIKGYYRFNHDVEEIKKFLREEEIEFQEAYGFNYWKSVLRLSLIEDTEFWEKYII
ncbi:MAG: HNH endonuclease signature motif containing protein [Chryseobacterium jejuense]|uniref:HNH endonuclease signature motif containing protein n=1 Tax=Chryseobacterium jejuense TaxID=445960 RepID=UPI003D0BA796